MLSLLNDLAISLKTTIMLNMCHRFILCDFISLSFSLHEIFKSETYTTDVGNSFRGVFAKIILKKNHRTLEIFYRFCRWDQQISKTLDWGPLESKTVLYILIQSCIWHISYLKQCPLFNHLKIYLMVANIVNFTWSVTRKMVTKVNTLRKIQTSK